MTNRTLVNQNKTTVFASKTYISPYGGPNSDYPPSYSAQFRLSSEPLKRTQAAEVTPRWRRRDSTRVKVHQNGRCSSQIV